MTTTTNVVIVWNRTLGHNLEKYVSSENKWLWLPWMCNWFNHVTLQYSSHIVNSNARGLLNRTSQLEKSWREKSMHKSQGVYYMALNTWSRAGSGNQRIQWSCKPKREKIRVGLLPVREVGGWQRQQHWLQMLTPCHDCFDSSQTCTRSHNFVRSHIIQFLITPSVRPNQTKPFW